MEKLYGSLLIILECIQMYVCLHISFRSRVRLGKLDVIYGISYISYYIVSNQKNLWFGLDILFVVLLYLWCLIKFTKTGWKALLWYLLGVVLLGVIQMFSVYLIEPVILNFGEETTMPLLTLAGIIGCLIVLLIYKYGQSDKKKISGKYVAVCAVIIFSIVVYTKLEYEANKNLHPYLYGICYFLLLLVLIGTMREQRIKLELENKAMELEMNERYGRIYEATLSEIRYKQHDYNNRMSTMLSMHYVAKDLEQLKTMQREYVGELEQDNVHRNILKSKGSPILVGYVYNECLRCEALGMSLAADVNVESNEHTIPLHKIIEILGILIDNAAEYYKEQNIDKKEIKLMVRDNSGKLVLEVCNQGHYMSNTQISNMFTEGYSSKGDGRGLGLASMKKIVDKYAGVILVDNFEIDKENWIKIRVEI